MKIINKLMLLPLVALPYNAMAAAAPVAPVETLNLTGATTMLNNDFAEKPTWRQGGTQIGAIAKPFNDPSFTWALGYIWNHAIVGTKVTWPPAKTNFPSWTSNSAADASPNADMLAKIPADKQPVVWKKGMISLSARPMTESLKKTVSNMDPNGYMSGTLTSYPFVQTYGVYVINANIPKGKGVWPAFWLLPYDTSWPPEIDVFEVLGADTKVVYNTVHYLNEKGQHTQKGTYTKSNVDMQQGWHEYALDWGPTEMKWYLDRKLVFKQPTPASLKKPCYVIVNIGVGKTTNWGGAPDATTRFPAEMLVDAIKIYQRPEYAGALAKK